MVQISQKLRMTTDGQTNAHFWVFAAAMDCVAEFLSHLVDIDPQGRFVQTKLCVHQSSIGYLNRIESRLSGRDPGRKTKLTGTAPEGFVLSTDDDLLIVRTTALINFACDRWPPHSPVHRCQHDLIGINRNDRGHGRGIRAAFRADGRPHHALARGQGR